MGRDRHDTDPAPLAPPVEVESPWVSIAYYDTREWLRDREWRRPSDLALTEWTAELPERLLRQGLGIDLPEPRTSGPGWPDGGRRGWDGLAPLPGMGAAGDVVDAILVGIARAVTENYGRAGIPVWVS